ncbi:MAG: Holliday junction resolvase RuvX [Cyclobacteriaceae bacterium]
MGRIICIDLGNKRTGIAVTDPFRIIATPLETVPTHTLRDFLKSYFSKEAVDVIVIGMPLKEDNSPTNMTVPVEQLYRNFVKIFPDKKIVLEDERYTSKMALEAMIAGGSSKKDRRNKGNIDKVSAAIILQSYMSRRGEDKGER